MSDKRSPDYPGVHSHDDDGPAPEMGPREASQGIRGHNVRIVLAVGTIGAIVAIAIAYVFFFGV